MPVPEKRTVPPSQDDFAKLVMDGLRRAGVTNEISYDPQQFQISVAGEKESTLFLNNGYHEYCFVAEEDRPHVLRRYVRGWLDAHKLLPEEFAGLQPDLLPAVRSRSFYEFVRLRAALNENDSADSPYQILGEDLAVGLVYDMPDAMRSISNKEFNAWGVTYYEAMETARENLGHLRPRIIGPKEGEGIYVFTTNDGYDSSRLILLELIRQFQVKGEYIAIVPGREMLIVAGSEDTAGLEAMLTLAKKALQEPRPISGVAVRLDGDDWVPWLPDPSHPHYDEFRMLRMQRYGQDYAEQKELLDALHEKTGEDIFVASFSVVEHKDTRQRTSYCVWTKGSHSLLPKTERIILGGPDQEPIMVTWDRVAEVVGDLMKQQGMYPERYRVEAFPTGEQLAAMGNELK